MTPVSYAGFWKRFAAYLIDKLLITTVSLMILIPVLVVFGVGLGVVASEGDDEDILAVALTAAAVYILIAVFIMILTWLYYALMESSTQQGTLGKMALSIKVTDIQGQRLTFGRATGRYFSKIISDLTFGIGYIIAGFTEKKQALHDMIASCLVVDKESV